MSAGKIRYDISATDAGLTRELNRINSALGNLDSRMFRMQDRFNRGFGNLQQSGVKVSGMFAMPMRQLAGMAAGAVSVQAVLSKMLATSREFSEEGLEAAKKWDFLFREFAGQSNLRGGALAQAEERIKKIGMEVGLDLENTARAATQMVSSGFSAQEASGDSLRVFLKGFVAANLAGQQVDMKDLTQATASYLSAQKMDKVSRNVQDVIQRVQTLYKTTNLQFADFAEFARESAPMSGILTVGEQLASYATLRDVMTAEEAATGLRNVTQRMRTAGGTKEKVEGLAMLGLKPEDVDMVGEDFLTAMQRISDGLKKTAPNLQPIALKQIFEERGVAIAEYLMKSLELVSQRIKEQVEGAGQFEKDVALAQAGVNAASRRQEAARTAFMAKSGREVDELRFEETRQYLLEKGYSPFRTSVAMAEARTQYYLGRQGADSVRAVIPWELDPDKTAQIIENRMNAKLQGVNLDPKKIEENIRKPVPNPGSPLNFDAGQAAIWEQERKRFSDPRALGRRSKLNPWFDRANRFPTENKAILEARKISSEIGDRIDLFGNLNPNEQEGFLARLNQVQKLGNLLPRNVHAYDLQLELNRAFESVGTPPPAPRKPAAPAPGDPAPGGEGGNPQKQNPAANVTVKLSEDIDRLIRALDQNTAATKGNTKSTGDGVVVEEAPPYRPTTSGQSRGSGL